MDSQKVRAEFSQPAIRLRERPLNGSRRPGEAWDEKGSKRRRLESVGGSGGENSTPSSTISSTATNPSNAHIKNPLDLRHPLWSLPPALITGFHSLNITEIYPWQCSCLRRRNVLYGRNLVYTAPTSAGKSLVADLLLLRRILAANSEKKAIIALPYVAIVTEKAKFLRKLLQGFPEVRVGEFYHGASTRVKWEHVTIAVCTIERANMFVNQAVREGTVSEIGVVVVDELHMVGDSGGRGAVLELFIAKLLAIAKEDVQIIGMSATLGNSAHLAEWLDAEHYESIFRPIKLEEYLAHSNTIYDTTGKPISKVPKSDRKELKSELKNVVVALAMQTVAEGHGVLVFCQSRQSAEDMAKLIGSMVQPLPTPKETMDARQNLIDTLRTTPAGLDPYLAGVIQRGVGYHHAGLTTEERDIVSSAYDSGLLKVICCTPTMAAGVNLPARRVIIHPRTGKELLTPITLAQMRGRAGRKGKDTVGESFLCCDKKDVDEVKKLVDAGMPSIASSLTNVKVEDLDDTTASSSAGKNDGLVDKNIEGVRRCLLEVISTNLATTHESIEEFMRCTLLYAETSSLEAKSPIYPLITNSLSHLHSLGLIAPDENYTEAGHYVATALGNATVLSSLPPSQAVFLHTELSRSQSSFNLLSELQIVYNLTPISIGTPEKGEKVDKGINWTLLRSEFEKLNPTDSAAALALGLEPWFINKMAQGGVVRAEDAEKLNPYRRVWFALMLRDMMSECRLEKVAERFEVERGVVQTLSTTCRGFAYTSVCFCRALGWGGMATLLEHYSERLDLGVTDDLMDLAKLPFVKSYTARIFFKAGFKTVSIIARQKPEKLVPLLLEAYPTRFKNCEGEALRNMLLKRAEIILKAAGRMCEREEEGFDEYDD